MIKVSGIITIFFLAACGTNQESKTTEPITAASSIQSDGATAGDGIVGDWEQQYSCFDKNGNNKLEPGEKNPSGTRLGFDWFRFNADGSCLRDRDMKFKGTYEIQYKNDTRKLVIHGGDDLRYTLIELTGKELILGTSGAFIVFKRI